MDLKYDVAVIGAGHNGLTCACYLAKAGLRVLVLEESAKLGGMTGTEEITGNGFYSDIHAFGYQLANLSDVPEELELEKFGFKLIYPSISCAHLFPDGKYVVIDKELQKTHSSVAKYSKKDADNWVLMVKQFREMLPVIRESMRNPPRSYLEEFSFIEEQDNGFDLFRFNQQTLRSWVYETFESDEARLLFGLFGHHTGTAPDDAGGAKIAWMFSCILQEFGSNAVKGGMGNLPLALRRCLENYGGKVKLSSGVKQILIQNGRANALAMDNGEIIEIGKAIISSVDPKHLVLDLLGEKMVGKTITNRIKNYHFGESLLGIYLNLHAPIKYKFDGDFKKAAYIHFTPPPFEYYGRSYLDSRSGYLTAKPVIILCNDSVIDSTRAPKGKALVKIIVSPVPYKIKGDLSGRVNDLDWANAKEAYADFIIDWLSKHYITDLKQQIIHRVVFSPRDYEQRLRSSVYGTAMHGSLVSYQTGAMRPIPELGQYCTPISNLFLCGSGSHPGPGVSFAPGQIAAQVVKRKILPETKLESS